MPESVPAVPQAKSAPGHRACSSSARGFLALLIVRAVRTYLLTRRCADLTVALGCAWLGVTLYANLVIGPMTVGFYIGHLLEICAVLLVSVPAALDIKRAGASRPLVGDLTATELVASEEAYLGPRVRALMVRLERRDVSTEEHTRRVALLAARVGEELKLSATARRHLAVGGLLHDIGKLAVPLEILNKPGKLTDEEFDAIKRHPGDGRKLLEELGGFPEAVRGLVSDHHERLDGSGYPRGLTPTSSTSRPASSPSATCTTRWSPTACTAPPGPPSARSGCSRRSRTRTTRPSSPRSSASSAATRRSSPTSPRLHAARAAHRAAFGLKSRRPVAFASEVAIRSPPVESHGGDLVCVARRCSGW